MTFQEATKLAQKLSSDKQVPYEVISGNQVPYGVCKGSKEHPEYYARMQLRSSRRSSRSPSPQGSGGPYYSRRKHDTVGSFFAATAAQLRKQARQSR